MLGIGTSILPCWHFFRLQLRNLHARGGIGLLGITEDRNSSFLQGAALAPRLIRQALRCDSSNAYSELGVDIMSSLKDFGDIQSELPNAETLCSALRPMLENIVKNECRTPLLIGGDHSVSYPVVSCLVAIIQKPVVIVHFDAHPDIYDNFEGNPWSHASPFARILEKQVLCDKLLSFGIRTANHHQREQMKKYNVHVVEARDFPLLGSGVSQILREHIGPDTPVYISIDLDVLEPGLAPGVSHREPGGLTVRQLIDAIHVIPGQIIGADLVEYNPLQDVKDITAFVASKIVKEIAARIILGPTHPRRHGQ
eukprot:gene33922-41053_t